jgi:hypothetical protein
MKYVKPKYEKLEILTDEIMTASGEAQSTITDGDLTISGKETNFAFDFSDLLNW